MIFAASWELSSRLYGLAQRFCPSNIVIRRVHTRSGIKWGALVGLAGVTVYGLLMVATGTIARDGGPGWVNLFFIIGFWNACRFTVLIPVSVVRLLRVRHQEMVLLRDWPRTHATAPAPAEPTRPPAPTSGATTPTPTTPDTSNATASTNPRPSSRKPPDHNAR